MAHLNWGDERVPEHFWKHLSPEPNSGCWLWLGALGNGVPSYLHKPSRKRHAVRRVTYGAAAGPIVGKQKLRPTCGSDLCCNPSHLRLGPRDLKSHIREYGRRWRLRTHYGLTVADVDSMLAAQHGRCAICHFKFSDECGPRVDHCHRTGRVRALLCAHCNSGLGMFNEDVFALKNAMDYLLKRGARPEHIKLRGNGE